MKIQRKSDGRVFKIYGALAQDVWFLIWNKNHWKWVNGHDFKPYKK